MTRHNKIITLLLTGVCLASAASAQTQSISKSYSRSLGNSYLGLTGYGYGYARAYTADPSQIVYTGGGMTLSSATARGYLRATAKILKSTRELGRFDARGDAYSRTTGVTTSGSYRLLLAGKTVSSKSFTATTSFPRFSKYVSLFPIDPRADIPVGPFTLRIKGNAGVGVETSGAATLTASPFVGLNCSAKAWGQGRANVEFGIAGFGVGAELKARLAQQSLATNLWVTGSKIRGAVEYYMVALRLKLRAYAFAWWGSYSKTVLDRSWGSFSKVLFRF